MLGIGDQKVQFLSTCQLYMVCTAMYWLSSWAYWRIYSTTDFSLSVRTTIVHNKVIWTDICGDSGWVVFKDPVIGV